MAKTKATRGITKPRRKLPSFDAPAPPSDPRDDRPLADDDRVAILGLNRVVPHRPKPFYYVYTFGDLPQAVQDLLKELKDPDYELGKTQDGSILVDPIEVGTWNLQFNSWTQQDLYDMSMVEPDFPEDVHALFEKDNAGKRLTEGERNELEEYVHEWELSMRSSLKETMLNDLKDFFYEMGKEAPDPVYKPWVPAKGVAVTITYDPQDW